ncbi:tyrosine-protein phosphatase [Acetobacterium malicum]|uniref:tyrosine-protein phosphatase n=1 Tax=Acetobacterium malicum TaxID=52692 RepID=UPI0035933FA9
MIDTHIHMVPGVDDGAKDLETAVQMMQLAMNEGVNEMILTPHFNLPAYHNQNVDKQYQLLANYIERENIDFKLHLGNEIYLSEETMAGIKQGQAHTMANSRFLLVELPLYHYYPFHESMLFELQESGYKVVLAHVERYEVFARRPEKLAALNEGGIYSQITSQYIMDNKTRKRALKWIESGLIYIVASDGHDLVKRPPVMKQAYEIVVKTFGEECGQMLFDENPGMMIRDRELMVPVLKKKKFGFRRQ